MSNLYYPVYDFKKVEQDIGHFWKEQDIFAKSLEKTRKGKRFVFWEGPPTANGMPHVGHFLTRIYKDLYGRYKTMRGFFVLRKAGWDTHGLPVEIEIEKELGFKNKKEIEEYGIAKFNRKARESALKYTKAWEEMSHRMGFWLDMKHPYITYETNYMESVWNILSEIWKRDLLYKAHKVVPFCVRCGTPLSAHEVAQGYKKVTDTSVYVKFKLIGKENAYILAWTTTPWTLPGNVALAVGKDIDYIFVEYNDDSYGFKKNNQTLDHYPSGTYILARELASKFDDLILWSQPKVVHGQFVNSQITFEQVLEKFKTVKGSELVGLEYEPLFEVPELKSDKSYRVYDADFVSTQDGTGVVHTAVMYGEDDYTLGTKVDLPKIHTVNEQGHFVDSVGDGLAGKYVKSKGTEDLILQKLTEKNLLFKSEPHEHDYPHCWRCNTPLLYYAKSSWFIKTSAINQELLANNATVNWMPAHLRDGRFGQWLREAKDWTLSRERYWGTPLPIWECLKCDHRDVVGSIKELEKRSVGPKNTYYVMRHGYTPRNEASPTDGIINTQLEKDTYNLTEAGRVGVEESLELLKMDGVDIIYTSPFKRTQETAQIAARILHTEVIVDERLMDISEGMIAEGKKVLETTPRKTSDDKPADGESWGDVRLRAAEFLKELESKYKNKKILIVSHQDVIWLMDSIANGLSAADLSGLTNLSMFTPGRLFKLNWRKIPRNEYGELDLHRPFIDEVIMKCPKCKSKMCKIPDLIDVWFDSGAMPYAQWHYPFENKDIFKKQFPADYIVEAVDQTRGWFWTLLAISTLLDKGAPYKNVMSLGFTLDEKGVKMSKSKGNYVPVMEFIETHGVDILRWYFFSSMTVGEDKAVIKKEIDDKLKGFFFTLQNCIRFYELYATSQQASEGECSPRASRQRGADPIGKLSALDKWLLSRFNRVLANAGEKIDKYEVTSVARELEEFVIEDLSNWWVRRSRKRREALPLLRFILLELSRVLAPFTPYMAEDMWHRLGGVGESVHLADWPKVQKKYLDEKLESEMAQARLIIARGLAIRKEKQTKVRQPLASLSIDRKDKFSRDIQMLIKEELNVKLIKYEKTILSTNQEGNVPVRHVSDISLDFELTPSLAKEGLARELMRMIQDMRKEAKYRMDDMVIVHWHSGVPAVMKTIEQFSEDIKKDTFLAALEQHPKSVGYDIEKESELAPGKTIWLGLKK